MSWDYNKHHVASKVLAKHMTELDRKQARLSARQDENMRDLERELISLHSVSTPDLGPGAGSPKLSKRTLPTLSPSASQSLTFGNGGIPSYSLRTESRQSRLTNRRQSEPVANIGRDLTDIQTLMNKAVCLADEVPDEGWNSLLETTLPGSKRSNSGYSRLYHRRGTIAQTEGLITDKLTNDNSSLSALLNSNLNRFKPRRGSLPLNPPDLKTVNKDSKTKKFTEGSLKEKQAKVGASLRRHTTSKSSKSFKEQNGVSVSFYNEDTGEESVPVVPHLKLNEADDSSVADENEDASLTKTDDNEAVWQDVAKCRYIRGYDPPEMIAPEEDPATFVFGRSYNDGFRALQKNTTTK